MDPELAAEIAAWEAYFYPETYDPGTGHGVMRNLYGIRDFDQLAAVEYELADMRARQLLEGAVRIPMEPDVSYLQAVHRHLFQDTYPWAGELRTVNMGKAGSEFADKNLLRAHVRPLMRTVVSTDWRNLDHEGFARMASITFAGINYAHPFREGNGRTTRAVLHEISKLSPFQLDFNQVTPKAWNDMSRATMPGRGEIMPRAAEAMAVFRTISVRRTLPVPEQRSKAEREISQRIFGGKDQGQDAARALRAGQAREQYQGYGKDQGRGR